jgi:Ser/Thr protein kinase RdoA (MazF antagonist)
VDAAVERVAARFGLTDVTVGSVPGGHINESFVVATPAGAYVLQRVNREVFGDPEGIMDNAVAVHLHLGGDLVPAPVHSLDGRWLVEDDTDVWRAFERVPDAGPPGPASEETAVSAAELLGRFHVRLADLDPGELVVTLPGFHDVQRRLDQLREVIAADPRGRVADSGPEIDLALSGADLVALAGDLDARTPSRVVHNDAKLDNFLFRDGVAVAIVDLDTLMPGKWFWDVGDLLRSATTSAAEDETDLDRVVVDATRYRSLVEGYRRTVSGVATDAEIEAVDAAGAIVTYEQALRFLADWLAGDVYYRTTPPQQNLDRARTQLRLFALMPHSPL